MKKITLLFITVLLFTAFNYTVQAAESQTAACTAGNLATVAASYLTTVTNLTVTGTIDARDFKTMRDDMPLLEVIDLSGSTVEAYTGAEGTNGTTLISYPANGVPERAFSDAFSKKGAPNLKTFIYPSSVTTIGHGAFEAHTGLTGLLTIPSTVTTIGYYAFLNCSGFTGTLNIPLSVTTIMPGAFCNCSGFTGSLTIPSSVTTIESETFKGCSGFTGSLTIPSSVTTIGGEAFNGCSGFTGTITIPSSVTTITDYAFLNFSAMFEVDLANTNYSSVDGVLFNKDKTTLIQCPISKSGNYIVPSTVTTIGHYAFESCSGFTGSLTIPSTVTTIGDDAFYGCSGLISINAYATRPVDIDTSWDVFTGVNKATCILHVPVGKKVLYEAANKWKNFTNIVEDIVITSIEKVQDSGIISIYPNPATSFITISELGSLVGNTIVTLSIVDVSGTPLLVKEVEPTINALAIDVSTLKKGTYFITGQTSNGNVVKRFIKD